MPGALVPRRAVQLRAPGVPPRGRRDAAGLPAIISRNEKGQHRELSWPELRRQVASLALHLKAGSAAPDRVAAYLPNIPEAMVAFLAVVASLGGVWSICAPDMGTAAVLDRFRQIEPKVLIACDRRLRRARLRPHRRGGRTAGGPCPRAPTLIVHQNLGVAEALWNLLIASDAVFTRAGSPEMTSKPRRLSHSGCRLTTRCGSSIPAAPPACPSPSCTMAMAVPSSWRWRSRPCTTTWAAATSPTTLASASTGTAPPAG